MSDLGGVTLQHIEQFLDELAQLELSPSTIAETYPAFEVFTNLQSLKTLRKPIPAELVDLPKKAGKLPEVLTAEEVLSIIDQADRTTTAGIRDAAILETLYATGMRVSELTGLELDNLFFEIGFIRVIGKGNKERLVPVGEHAQTLSSIILKRQEGSLSVKKIGQNP